MRFWVLVGVLGSLSPFLTGCGFQPLYAPLSSQTESFSQRKLSGIRINLITDRRGQLLRNNLIQILTPKGEPKNPLYILDVHVAESSQALGILKDATFSKSQMTYTGAFTLKDAKTYKVLLKNSSVVVSDYNVITDNEFATVVSADSAKKRSMILLAQQISKELAAFFFKEEESSSQE